MEGKVQSKLSVSTRMKTTIVALSALVAVPMLWDAGGVAPPPLGATEASAETNADDQAQASAGQTQAPTSLPNVSRVFEQQKEKVVAIKAEIAAKKKTKRGHPFSGQMPQRPRTGQGSGFIVDEDGYIITNHHVVGDAAAISVILQSGDSYPAEVVGSDPSTDIALLKVEPDGKLPAVRFGDSSSLKVGQWVVAIGNPFGLDYSVTTGIVSATGRNIGHGPYDDFIQTDASINPGNSGGPLFNLNGEVVGVNSAIIRGGQGIGFAVPVDMVEQMLPQLRESGYVSRGYIGAGIQELDRDLAKSFGVEPNTGVLIGSIADDGPAADAGIRPGDIVTRFNGKEVNDAQSLLLAAAKARPGTDVPLEVIRDGEKRSFNVAVAERPGSGNSDVVPTKDEDEGEARLGVMVVDVNAEIAKRMGLERATGVAVQKVLANSPAARVLRPGDVILQIGKQEISSVASLKKALKSHPVKKPVRLLVHRDGRTIFLAVRLDK